MIRALALIALLASLVGCIRDSYECTTDADCNLGTAGRCEIDNRCTQYDADCVLTQRSYSRHSAGESAQCYLGQIDLVDPCAAGQPPADPAGACAATVCAKLPTCCAAGWSQPCVIAAETACDLQCETRVAISALHGSAWELWDLRYDGASFTATSLEDRTQQLDWLAPAPGSDEPRLASFIGDDQLEIKSSAGTVDLPVNPAHAYHDVASVDFDRDRRDTIALEYKGSAEAIDVAKVDTGDTRSFATLVSNRMAWGDLDQNGYPDVVAGTAAHYNFLLDAAGDAADGYARTLYDQTTSSFNGSADAGATSLRDLEWVDADGDQYIDLVAFGNSIRVHRGGVLLEDNPFVSIDCVPPIVLGTDTCPGANWVGALVPGTGGGSAAIYAANTEIVAAGSGSGSAAVPTRAIYRIALHGDADAATFVPLSIDGLTGPPGDGPDGADGSAVAAAVVAADLDGDHAIDILIVDSQLGIWVALSSKDPTLGTFEFEHPILTTTYAHSQVHASISGMTR